MSAKRFESNISNGRKIFRLLLWLNEVQEIENLVKSSKLALPLRMLRVFSHVCSFIYYLTDNIVWFANMDFCPSNVPFAQNLKWKQVKNIFSLAKTILELIISGIMIVLKKREERELS